MGPNAILGGLLFRAAAYLGWSLDWLSSLQKPRWISWFGALCIIALLSSVVSPNDDLFQQELFRPTASALRDCAHGRPVPTHPRSVLSVSLFTASKGRVPGIHLFSPPDQPEFEMCRTLRISTHSPPQLL
jgi:hypothetical protein